MGAEVVRNDDRQKRHREQVENGSKIIKTRVTPYSTEDVRVDRKEWSEREYAHDNDKTEYETDHLSKCCSGEDADRTKADEQEGEDEPECTEDAVDDKDVLRIPHCQEHRIRDGIECGERTKENKKYCRERFLNECEFW